MHKSLEKRYDKIVQEYSALLDICETLDAEQLNTATGEGKWSIAQILFHLNLSTKNSIAYLHHKMQDPDSIPNKNTGTWFRSKLLNFALKSNLKFKAPKGIDVVPQKITAEQLKADWKIQQTALHRFLFAFPEKMLNKTVFRHPFVGRLTMAQTLEFMQLHILHHSGQIGHYLKNQKKRPVLTQNG